MRCLPKIIFPEVEVTDSSIIALRPATVQMSELRQGVLDQEQIERPRTITHENERAQMQNLRENIRVPFVLARSLENPRTGAE